MDGGLQLRLSLLRGETACAMDMDAFGRLSAIDLRIPAKPALSDRLAVAVLGMIASGSLPPGGRLPPERRIAKAVPASRDCVRSALGRLKAEGYIESVRGSGTRVRPIEASGTVAGLIQASEENLEDLRGFVAFLDRCLVEGLSRRPDRAAIADRVATLAGAGHDPAEAETDLRLALADATGSVVYALVANRLRRGMRSLFSRLPGDPDRDASRARLERLERLAVALRDGDADAAFATLSATTLASTACPSLESRPGGPALHDFAVEDPEHLKDRLARDLATLISTRRACPDGRLMGERRLAVLFGVSRSSVREALRALGAAGLVAKQPRAHTRVMSGAPRPAEAYLADLDRLKAMARLRGYLEVLASGRAAARGSVADFADLRRILAELGRTHLSPRRRIDLDMRLHLTIARASGSALHLYVAEVLRDLTMAYFDDSLGVFEEGPERDAMLLAHHTRIVSAILARDVAGAEQAMREHCGAFSSRYEIVG